METGVPAGTAGSWRAGMAVGTAADACWVCPKADTDMPEANRRTPAPTTVERAIEARNCWYKRIAVLSREESKDVGA